jgi:hypothetical protein
VETGVVLESITKKSLKGLFSNELDILNANQEIANGNADEQVVRKAYKELCENYEDLLDQTRLLTKVGDKLQNKLNNINQAINDKNIELQNTIDELTRAKVGRKAATLTLLFVIFLFVISEGVIDPIIDSNTNGNTWLSMVYKAVIALLLKPLEGFLEKYLMKSAIKKRVVTLK